MNIIYQINSIIWNVINMIPMPLRMFIGIIIFIYIIQIIAVYLIPLMVRIMTLVLYWTASAVVSLIVLPEYLITSKRRQNGADIHSSYSQVGALLETAIQKLYKLYIEVKQVKRITNIRVRIKKYTKFTSTILVGYLAIVWFAYPTISNQETKKFAGKSLALWCSFEDLNLNRKWTPLNKTENQINQRIYGRSK